MNPKPTTHSHSLAGFSRQPKRQPSLLTTNTKDLHNMSNQQREPPPHMEWKNNTFTPQIAEQPLIINIKVSIIDSAHQKFGKSRKEHFAPISINAMVDSGCQTYTGGLDFLRTQKCPTSYLISTQHRIISITNSPLDIAGVVFVELSFHNKQSRQMVYISRNCKDL